MIFTIQMNYNASLIASVDAEDEGEALDKAREWAENADISEFTIGQEQRAVILRRD